jgi:hypothetical protein
MTLFDTIDPGLDDPTDPPAFLGPPTGDPPPFMGGDSAPSVGFGTGRRSGREDHFELETGQFRDPATGRFEPGGPPPDYDPGSDRYRAADGRFKPRSADLFDEPAEVRLDQLYPEG